MITPGTLLQNRYRLAQQIGRGGMGAVYVATDERFQSTVAIKQTFFFEDPTLRKAFEREAHLLNHLRHSALPKVSDHFIEDAGQFLVMEFIEGSDLGKLLHERGGAFPVADVLRWADELLDALDYLHTHKPPVIHRDIKPQNMKLTTRGQIVLLDFGLAKGTPVQTHASVTASVLGYSPQYAPLEQVQGNGTDPRSDIYSLGATLYHLLTGVPPVDALTRAGAVINNQPDPLRPAHVAHTQVPQAVSRVIHRAMAQNAAHRPTTAAGMRDMLRQASNADPLTARKAPAAAAFIRGRSESEEVTVLELPDGQQSNLHGETTIDGGLRPPLRTLVVQPLPPAQRSRAKMFVVAAALLVACVVAAFTFTRSGAPAKLEAQTATPADASVGTQAESPAPNQTETANKNTDTPSASTEPVNTQTQATSQSNPATSTTNTPSTPIVGAEAAGVLNNDGSNTGSGEASGAAPVTGTETQNRPALVIHQPAPSQQPAASNAPSEQDLRRADEARRAEEFRHRPMGPPPPPPYGGRHPPFGGGPPPPRRRP